MAEYTVVRSDPRQQRWAVLKDGESICLQDGRRPHEWYKSKKEALAAIPNIQARQEYEARVLTQDETGVYVWTEQEEKSIAEFAAALVENPEKWTMAGKQRLQDIARTQHDHDASTIESWQRQGEHMGQYGRFICAEVRRVRIARIEAFRRAGLQLDRLRWSLRVWRDSKPKTNMLTFVYSSREAAEAEQQDIINRGKEFGELDYRFELLASATI